VQEEILKHGGTPRRERVGHSFMKKTLHDSHACFGGELSGHFYYRDNFFADSGMITLVHMLNILGAENTPASKRVAPLRRFSASGEINFEVEEKEAMMKELARKYSQGQVDDLDGVTVQFKEWWFNVRPSNTEPLLRLNVEAKSPEMLDERLDELKSLLGEPADH
jgi:phosphomannomutase